MNCLGVLKSEGENVMTPDDIRSFIAREYPTLDAIERHNPDGWSFYHRPVTGQSRWTRIIRAVRPDVLVKGADWQGKTVDGQRFVESYGGRVALAPLLAGHGTTLTLERLRGGAASRPPAVNQRAGGRAPRRQVRFELRPVVGGISSVRPEYVST